MSDVKREEFESWVQRRAARSPAGYHPRLIKRCELDPDRYAISWVDSAFEGWQGFQEFLVIELPADAHLSRDGLDENYLAGDMRDQIVESIHAAGVKTK